MDDRRLIFLPCDKAHKKYLEMLRLLLKNAKDIDLKESLKDSKYKFIDVTNLF